MHRKKKKDIVCLFQKKEYTWLEEVCFFILYKNEHWWWDEKWM